MFAVPFQTKVYLQVPTTVLNVTLRLQDQWPCWKSCLWQYQVNSLTPSHNMPAAVPGQKCRHSLPESSYWTGFKGLWLFPCLFELLLLFVWLFGVWEREGVSGRWGYGIREHLCNRDMISLIRYKWPPLLDIIKLVLESFGHLCRACLLLIGFVARLLREKWDSSLGHVPSAFPEHSKFVKRPAAVHSNQRGFFRYH